MKKIIKENLPYVIIAALVAFIFINRSCDFEGGQTRTVTTDSTSVVTEDSTEVDWSWVDMALDTPDTVFVEIPVPVPSIIEETDSVSTRTYNQSYEDSLIHAKWTTRVAGELLEQQFEYTPQVQRVGVKTVTKWRTMTNTITKTIRIKDDPNGHLVAGGMVGLWADHQFIAPEIGWVSKRGDVFEVAYDPMKQGVVVSGNIKISFRGLLPF